MGPRSDAQRKHILVEDELGELTVQDDIHVESKKADKKNSELVFQGLMVCRDTGSKT